ncbi:hypothetical protein CYY_000662 [Polysphondylium violaceum]|uniref:N-acetylglucosaminylphosphatidylinositol deacetylase n=1 Tax=Polysphondylium violaceum TaxID=133409 RepID=A0A8J4Q4E9_9MYCE|nr:hypothetical protein CYY_000662 [Polysphondylium violaceum]
MDYFKKKRDASVKRTVAFVIAHPDDECMFFTPTILHYKRMEYNIIVLCISSGNQAGLGRFRSIELVKSCNELGIPGKNVIVIDWPTLQDGMDQHWTAADVASLLEEMTTRYAVDEIVTFDEWGVSGHPNHCDTHRGVIQFLQNYQQARSKNLPHTHRKQVEDQKQNKTAGQMKEIRGYKLETVGIIRKYIGIWDIWVSKLFGAIDGDSYHAKHNNSTDSSSSSHSNSNPTIMYTSTQLFPPCSYDPMKQHQTQLVWFRYLFIFLSRYSYINTLTEIKLN